MNKLTEILNTMKTKATIITALVFIVACSIIRSTQFPEGDIFWGARNGMDTLDNGIHIVQPDKWNLQTLGEAWSPNSWLWNVLLGAAYQTFGNYGFLVVTLLANLVALGFLVAYLHKLRMPPLAFFGVLVLAQTVMAIWMNGRGNTADFMILSVFLYFAHKFRTRRVILPIIAFFLTAVWMNLHLTGVIATMIFPALAYVMLYTEGVRKKLIQSSLVLLGTLIALPLTPFGLEGLVKVSLVKNESKGLIVEWANVLDVPELQMNFFILLGVAFFVLIMLYKRKQYLYGLFILVFMYGTFDTIRLSPFLLATILGSLVLWEKSTFTFVSLHPRIAALKEHTNKLMILVMCGSILLFGFSITQLIRVAQDESRMFYTNSTELSLIPKDARAAVSQDSGSAIILYRPDVLVTLDGRNDLIGAKRFLEASNILYSESTNEVKEWLEDHNINAVFVDDGSTDGAARIAKTMNSLGWGVQTNETKAIAYVKKDTLKVAENDS